MDDPQALSTDQQELKCRYGSLIRELRSDRGLRATDLATLCGKDATAISHLEGGRDPLGLQVAADLDEYLAAKGQILSHRLYLLMLQHKASPELARRIAGSVQHHWTHSDLPVAPSTGETGLIGLTTDFYRGVPWSRLLRDAQQIDIFFTYGRSWRHTLTSDFDRLAHRGKYDMRVIMPDTSDPTSEGLLETAKRAGQTVAQLTLNIQEAVAFFHDTVGADIWFSQAAHLFASYRFDDTIVVTLYNNQRGQTSGIPTLICHRGGSFFEFFESDFTAMISDPRLTSAWSPD